MARLENDPAFASQFVVDDVRPGFDYVSRDGRIGIELKTKSLGVRDLDAAAIQFASRVNLRKIARACLVVGEGRISRSRMIQEWQRIRGILNPTIAKKLSLIGVGPNGAWVEPADARIQAVADQLQRLLGPVSADAELPSVRVARSGKLDEITKVLIIRWLQRLGPIRSGELSKLVGASTITTLAVIRLLAVRGVLIRLPNQPVELSKFPVDWWAEASARSRNDSTAWRFVDASGQPTAPELLLKRLARMKVPGLAIGGVVSARHWCPDLDLNGTPRLDLVLHAPTGQADLQFMKRVDPALRLVDRGVEQNPVVVIHPLQRAVPLYESSLNVPLPVADPVETALHLESLRLPMQARQVLARLRPELRYL